MKKILIGVLLLGMTGVGVALGEAGSASRTPASDFNVKRLDGQTLQLSALKGKVVLLDFWATWCPPCRAEIPHFKELYDQYKGKGLEIIGLALDQDGEATVRSFAKQNGIHYPLAMGSQALAQAYGGVLGIPTTFLIDKQGKIAQKYVGYHEKAVFETQIRALLAE